MKRCTAWLAVTLVVPVVALAWIQTGHRFLDRTLEFRLGDVCDAVRFPATPGTCAGDAANPDWKAEITTALGRWNSATDLFNFTTNPAQGAATPGTCDSNDPSSVFFLPDICGGAFGTTTLAVARTFSFTGGEATHSDMVFNSSKTWGAYDDSRLNHPGTEDFRRVAVHESGHVLGLNHPPHTAAIMYFQVQDVTGAQADDLNGVKSLYGVLANSVSPDTSGNSVQELVAVRSGHDGSIVAELRDASSGALLKNITFLSNAFTPVDFEVLPDQDANGKPELAILAMRNSDGRGLVEIRNLSGTEAPRIIWFGAGLRPIKLAVVDDADSNGLKELAVLATRNSDGRALVEVKNAFGATQPNTIWFMPFAVPLDMTTIADADHNNVPEIAVLLARFTDNRGVVEVKNAVGATNPSAVWAMPGVSVKRIAEVDDADGNSVPEVAIMSRRNSDGRIVVEVKNAVGATNPATLWFATGHTADAVVGLPDVDGNSVAEVAVLSRRNSDGRIVVEVKNAAGATNPSAVWFTPGFATIARLSVLDDVNNDAIHEVAVMLSRQSDGRLMIEERNARGSPTPKNVWLTP